MSLSRKLYQERRKRLRQEQQEIMSRIKALAVTQHLVAQLLTKLILRILSLELTVYDDAELEQDVDSTPPPFEPYRCLDCEINFTSNDDRPKCPECDTSTACRHGYDSRPEWSGRTE